MPTYKSYSPSFYRYSFTRVPEWEWKFRVPTPEMVALREEFLAQSPDETAQMIREIALTFGGTNILSDSGQDFILYIGDPIPLMELVLGEMPYEMLWEIWEAIKRQVPGWGPKEIE